VRQLRALLRHRTSLVRLGNRIHAVAADHGYDRSASYWTGPGRGWLAELALPAASREIITYFLADIDGLAPLTDRIDGELHAHAKADPGSRCCGRCLVSGSSPPWSCSPRSATSTGSPAPASSPPGRLTPAGPVDLPDRLAQLNDLRASSGRVPDQHPPVGGSTANAFTEPSWRPSSAGASAGRRAAA